MGNTESNFVAWEYTNINVNRNDATLYADCYRNFGWTLIGENEMDVPLGMAIPRYIVGPIVSAVAGRSDHEIVTLKFKRDSRLPHKIQLEQLQRRCEGALSSIQQLENTKSIYRIGPLIGFGMFGAAGLGFSIYTFLLGNIPLCVLFAAISLIGWIAAFYSYAKAFPKKTAQVNPQIQEQFEIIYQTCEQANGLLA